MDYHTSSLKTELLKCGDYLLIDEQYPCRITQIKKEMSSCRRSRKAYIQGKDIFTDKSHDEIRLLSSNVRSPIISKEYYRVSKIEDNNYILIDHYGIIIDGDIVISNLNDYPFIDRIKSEVSTNENGGIIATVISGMGYKRLIRLSSTVEYKQVVEKICIRCCVPYIYFGLFNALMHQNKEETNMIIFKIDIRDHNFLAYRIAHYLGHESFILTFKDTISKINWYERQVFELQINPLIGYPSDIPKILYYYTRSLFK